ncbi:MAG: response regulator [Chitinophagaceae bacterium]
MTDSILRNEGFRITITEDDFEDFQLMKSIFEENKANLHISHVKDGQALIDDLSTQAKLLNSFNLPHIIMLDLSLPRKTGLEALREIKENYLLCKIPVIIFATSISSTDIQSAYELGCSSYIAKPQTASEWFKTIGDLCRFWMECVIFPV